MSNLSVSQRFRPPCDDGKERVTCVLCGAVHETWTELVGNTAEDPKVARRGCNCSMCRGITKVCKYCAYRLGRITEAIVSLKHTGDDEYGGDLIKCINNLEVNDGRN